MISEILIQLRLENRIRLLNLILVLALLAPSLSLIPASAQPSPVQPILLELAAEEPETLVSIIVQKRTKDDRLERLVAHLGGRITKNLRIINAFAAEVPAGIIPTLAQTPGVRWISLDAPMVKSDTTPETALTLRDTFELDTFTNSQGTVLWKNAWVEIGEEDGPAIGDVRITSFLAGSARGLRIQNANRGVWRPADLAHATYAELSFQYRRKGFHKGDAIAFQISSDGGQTWSTLDQFIGPATDPALQFASYDITPYAGPQTVVRFLTAPFHGPVSKFYVDNFQIKFLQTANPQPVKEGLISVLTDPIHLMNTTQTVRDEFNSTSFSNNDGTALWASDWIETGDSTGPSAGNITVEVDSCPDPNSRCIEFDARASANDAIEREVDLSTAPSATLTFDYHLDGSDATFALDVSADGGATWTTLRSFSATALVFGESVDLSAYIAPATRIRFRLAAPGGTSTHLYLDNVEIAYTTGSPVGTWFSVRDEFNTSSFSNNDGTANWAGDWIENDPESGGAGPDHGAVKIRNQMLRLDDQEDTGGEPSLARTVDLAQNVTQATLSFDFSTTSEVDRDDAVVVEISADGGLTYTILETFTNISGYTTGSRSYDITPYISAETTVRFRVSDKYQTEDEFFYVDNVQILATCPECIETSNLASTYVQAIQADRLWNTPYFLQGQGINVAVVDSGIAPHEDLKDEDFGTSRIVKAVQFNSSSNYSVDDFYGHGTHVAGIIGGNGEKSLRGYMGVAPKVGLIDVKVNDDSGAGTMVDIIEGLQWILDNKEAYDIRVVNLSMNSSVAEPYHVSPLDAALEILWFNQIVVVVSAGNNGAGLNSGILYPPANDPFVIVVGATDDMGTPDISDDTIAAFSAQGITESGFVKPDILAPGTNIINLLASDDCNLALSHPAHMVAGMAGNAYFRMSGTSMASAVTAGAVALLLQDEPSLTPDQVKYRLMATAQPLNNNLGIGYLNVHAAVEGTTTQNANTGVAVSQLLTTGSDPVNGINNWNSVNWDSVNWDSVNWDSVNWDVNWDSVNWGSVHWDD